jgi:two-component system phosphate regulon response regulator PhoB
MSGLAMDGHSADGQPRRPLVLVVDDEPVIRELVQATLARDPRLQVVTACDGEEALAVARTVTPDLVLLDVRMPRLGGIAACRALRADPATRDVRIVLLTAAGQDADVERGYDAGADDYFLKPFLPDELLDRTRAALRLPAA